MWRAYEPDDVATAGVVGQLALAEETLDPGGWARLGPELWRVELAHGAAAVPRGAKLRVVGVHGPGAAGGARRAVTRQRPLVLSTSVRSSSTQSS